MNQMTTGASNDFERATQLARDMVTRYGMSEAMGPMVYAENEGEVFLGRSVTKTTHVSELTMQKVDAEIRRIIDEQYAVARRLIEENRDKMEVMAKALLDWGDDRRRTDQGHHGGPSARPPKNAPNVAQTARREDAAKTAAAEVEKAAEADQAGKADEAEEPKVEVRTARRTRRAAPKNRSEG